MKRIFKLIFGIVFIMFIVSCGGKGVKKEEDPNLPKYSVEINIKCDGNLFFSKYDVDVYIDDDKVVTVKHGENYVDIVKLTEGKHTLIFKKKNDKSVDGKVEFLIKEDTKLNYQIHCNSDKVSIKEIAEGKKKEEVQESKENEDSNESDINEKNNESLEATFPKENAKRAIVVSLTNAYSSDVFKKDGNTYDLKKFHSYAEVPEFNLKIEKDGEWTAKDEKTWHVENIELKTSSKNTNRWDYLL